MKTSLPRPLQAFAFLALLSLAGFAQAETPNLVGTWKGDYLVSTPDGVKKSSIELVITQQSGPNFMAERIWKRTDGSIGQHKGEASTGGTEKMLGVIDFDNQSVLLVESGKGWEANGILRGRIAHGDKLLLVFIQAGEVARAGRMELTRQK